MSKYVITYTIGLDNIAHTITVNAHNSKHARISLLIDMCNLGLEAIHIQSCEKLGITDYSAVLDYWFKKDRGEIWIDINERSM